jgi:hypothetical protein
MMVIPSGTLRANTVRQSNAAQAGTTPTQLNSSQDTRHTGRAVGCQRVGKLEIHHALATSSPALHRQAPHLHSTTAVRTHDT